MAIDKTVRYPGRWGAVSAEYPLGQPKNRTSPTAKDGTYLEKDWISDYEAFFASLMDSAGFSANGLVDKVGASQFFDAFQLSESIGINQAWQDVTESRADNVTYTNTTGRPIVVATLTTVTTGGYISVDGVIVSSNIGPATGDNGRTISTIIPAGSTYMSTVYPGRASGFSEWRELR